jgi:hypothetical protein
MSLNAASSFSSVYHVGKQRFRSSTDVSSAQVNALRAQQRSQTEKTTTLWGREIFLRERLRPIIVQVLENTSCW